MSFLLYLLANAFCTSKTKDTNDYSLIKAEIEIKSPIICDISLSTIKASDSILFCNRTEMDWSNLANKEITVFGSSKVNQINVSFSNKIPTEVLKLNLNNVEMNSFITKGNVKLMINFFAENIINQQLLCSDSSQIELDARTSDNKPSSNSIISIFSGNESLCSISGNLRTDEEGTNSKKCKQITFSGGKVRAENGLGADFVEKLFINGGELSTKYRGINGAEYIEINGGKIFTNTDNNINNLYYSNGKEGSAGIGGSFTKFVRIGGGEVKSFGGYNFAAIEAQTIQIIGGKINAVGGDNAAAVGSSSYYNYDAGSVSHHSYVNSILIASASILATGGVNGAGIGSSAFDDVDEILIYSGNIDAIGGSNAAGIGTGSSSNVHKIFIKGGDITSHGGKNAAGIGCGVGNTSSSVSKSNVDLLVISGGVVTATGGEFGAGIGGGLGFNVDASLITDSKQIRQIKETLFQNPSKLTSLRILGGEVIAKGGKRANGIGCGLYSLVSSISISGGIITATPSEKTDCGIGSENVTLLEIFAQSDSNNNKHNKCLKILSQNGHKANTIIVSNIICNADNSICELVPQLSGECVSPWTAPVILPDDLIPTYSDDNNDNDNDSDITNSTIGDFTPEPTLLLHNLYIAIPAILGSFLGTAVLICLILQIYLKKHPIDYNNNDYSNIGNKADKKDLNRPPNSASAGHDEIRMDKIDAEHDGSHEPFVDNELPSIRKKASGSTV